MVHYSDYLQLEKVLGAQSPESDRHGQPAHDEMLFIVIHQAYELWFKQLLFETESVIGIMQQPALNDNSPELQTVVHRLSRCSTILKVLVHQIDIMETMTPMDFLDFRDMLRPASGFQSWQFKLLEARLGLKYQHRFGQQYYLSQLRQPEIDRIRDAEKAPSLLELVNKWLERMPFFSLPDGAEAMDTTAPAPTAMATAAAFWTDYRLRYLQSLADAEKNNMEGFDRIFFGVTAPHPGSRAAEKGAPIPEEKDAPAAEPAARTASCPMGYGSPTDAATGTPMPGSSSATTSDSTATANSGSSVDAARSLSPSACRSALFIMLYRGYPMLQLPFQVLNQLLEIDEQLSTWRYRHMSMVHRMIGTRIGTGGSTGKDYLGSALAQHHLFKEIAGLTSFLIERKKLPQLTPEMERRLGFAW